MRIPSSRSGSRTGAQPTWRGPSPFEQAEPFVGCRRFKAFHLRRVLGVDQVRLRCQVARDDPPDDDSVGDYTRGTGEGPGDGPGRRDRETGLPAPGRPGSWQRS
jgi:hypothetical protein